MIRIDLLNMTPDGFLIGRCADGIDKVHRVRYIYNNRKDRVAKIVKIFGSVKSPYIKAEPLVKKNLLMGAKRNYFLN